MYQQQQQPQLTTIQQLPACVNQTVHVIGIAASCVEQVAKNNSTYYKIKLLDKTGERYAFLFDTKPNQEAVVRQLQQQQALVYVIGKVNHYQNEYNLHIQDIQLTQGDITQFVPTAPYAPQDYIHVLSQEVASITSPLLRHIIEAQWNQINLHAPNKTHTYLNGVMHELYVHMQAIKAFAQQPIQYDVCKTALLLYGISRALELDTQTSIIPTDATEHLDSVLIGTAHYMDNRIQQWLAQQTQPLTPHDEDTLRNVRHCLLISDAIQPLTMEATVVQFCKQINITLTEQHKFNQRMHDVKGTIQYNPVTKKRQLIQ